MIAWGARENLELLFVWPSAESVVFYERAEFGFSPMSKDQGSKLWNCISNNQ